MANQIRWKGELRANLANEPAKHRRAMFVAAKKVEGESITYMRANASWTDRTGNARNGLNATTVVGAEDIAIVLYHRVPYGVFLETRWSGKYAIIMPTVSVMGNRYMQLVGKLLFSKGSL